VIDLRRRSHEDHDAVGGDDDADRGIARTGDDVVIDVDRGARIYRLDTILLVFIDLVVIDLG
jgi:hypothetical protein